VSIVKCVHIIVVNHVTLVRSLAHGSVHITNALRNAMKYVIVLGVIILVNTLYNVNIPVLVYVENLAQGFVEYAKSKSRGSKITVLILLI